MENMEKTGIEYLKSALDKNNKFPMLFETAEMLQMEIMNEFSLWLADNNYELKYVTGNWKHIISGQIKTMSELYEMFLNYRK